MRGVSVEEFAARVKATREELRLSRPGLSRLSGVSESQIEKLERSKPPTPHRPTVIDLCHALGLDINKWLRTLSYDPLTPRERELLPAAADPWPELQEAWPKLTPAQRQAIVVVARAFLGASGYRNSEDTETVRVTPIKPSRARQRRDT